MHPDLEQAISFHESIVAEGSKALVGYDTAKALANVVLMSEIPTSYDKKEQRQVNAGKLLLRGQDISALPVHKRSTRLVWQNFALFPHLNVRRNIAEGRVRMIRCVSTAP